MQATIFATSSDPNFEIPDNITYFNQTTNRFEQQGRTNDVNQFSNLNNLSQLTSNRQEINVINFEGGDKLNLALDQLGVQGASLRSLYRIDNSNGQVRLLRREVTCSYGFCPDTVLNTVLDEYSDIKIISGVNYSTRVTQDELNKAISNQSVAVFNFRNI